MSVSVLEARRAIARPALGVSSVAVETIAVAAIVVAAALARWPELMVVPRFTDESSEILLGVSIARGEALPLANWHPHIGAAFNYLVAASLLIVGPTIEAGRLVVWLLGALTVVPTYLLGRSIGGPAVGGLAALFLATSGLHIVVNSHIAYSHSVVPLFSMLSLWLIHRAISVSGPSPQPARLRRGRGGASVGRGHSGRWLAAGLTMLGLATQFHPSALVLAPGIVVYLALHRRAVSLRWLLLGGLGASLAVANLVIFNVLNGLSGVTMAADMSGRYLGDSGSWADRLALLLGELPVGIAGLVTETAQPNAILQPVVLAFAALTVLGLGLLTRRREWLLLLVAISAIGLISLLNGRLAPVVTRGRHYALIVPVAYVCLAYALVALHGTLSALTRRPGLVQPAMLLLTGALIVGPLVFVQQYYDQARLDGRTNQVVLQTLNGIARYGHRDERVYFDEQLQEERTMSGGRLLEQLRMGLAMRGQEYEVVDVKNTRLPLGRRGVGSRVLVLRQDNVELASGRYRLEPLSSEPGPGAVVRVFRAFPRGGGEASTQPRSQPVSGGLQASAGPQHGSRLGIGGEE